MNHAKFLKHAWDMQGIWDVFHACTMHSTMYITCEIHDHSYYMHGNYVRYKPCIHYACD